MLILLHFQVLLYGNKLQGGSIAIKWCQTAVGELPNAAMAHGSSFGDTTYTKVFVGGLAWETGRETMRAYFEQFGEILEAVVITDRQTGRSKGYGFVTFKDEESARRACADPTPIIDGRRANCNLASLGQKPRQGRGPRSDAGSHGAGPAFPSFPQQNPYAYPPNPQQFGFQSFGFSQPPFDSTGAYGYQQQQFPYGQQGYITGPTAGFQNPPGGHAYGGYPSAFGQFPQQGFVGGAQPGPILQPVYPVLGQQQLGGASGQHYQAPGQAMSIPQPLPQGPVSQSAQPGGQQQYSGQQQFPGLIPGGKDGGGPTG